METRDFHIGDVLSVTTDYLLSPDGIGGVYEILNFMTQDNLFTHQLPRASRECRPWLLRQHPQLESDQMQFALGELIEFLDTPSGKADPEHLVLGWLVKQTAWLGETLPVEPIHPAAHDRKEPIAEAAEMVGGDRVIVAVVADENSPLPPECGEHVDTEG